jgi:hypothetical protein
LPPAKRHQQAVNRVAQAMKRVANSVLDNLPTKRKASSDEDVQPRKISKKRKLKEGIHEVVQKVRKRGKRSVETTSYDEDSNDDEGQVHRRGRKNEKKGKGKAKRIAESSEEESDVDHLEGPSDVDKGERIRITGTTYVDRLIVLDNAPNYYPSPEAKEDIAFILDCSRSEVEDPGTGRLDALLRKCVSSCGNCLLKI